MPRQYRALFVSFLVLASPQYSSELSLAAQQMCGRIRERITSYLCCERTSNGILFENACCKNRYKTRGRTGLVTGE
jgi:hypothetical protein